MGFLTLGISLASLLVPLPFLRVILAVVIAFVVMMIVPKPRSGQRF